MILHLQSACVPGRSERRPLLLCVDDNQSTLYLNAQILSANGFDVVATDRPQDVLDLMDKFDVRAVLTDFDMPLMNGGELAAKIKRAKSPRPVILRSGSLTIPPEVSDDVDVFAPKSLGIQKFLDQIQGFTKSMNATKTPNFDSPGLAIA